MTQDLESVSVEPSHEPALVTEDPESTAASAGSASDISYLPWSVIGAVVFFAAVLSFAANFLATKFVPGLTAVPHVVTFDAIRFTNAQRVLASKFMVHGLGQGGATSDQALILNQSSRVEKTIREVAGPKTIVLVKQAVVASTYPDITDEVLTRLGLPTNTPSTLPDLEGLMSRPDQATGPQGYAVPVARPDAGVLP
jgi:hypothetical protein